MTSIRWKPQTTYRSPNAGTSTLHLEGRLAGSDVSSSSQSSSPQSLPLQLSPPSTIYQSTQSKRRRRWMMGPSLPLYHPLGRLALSLPDLDPTAFGLPAPAVIIDDPTRRSSNRARRPAPKVRDANEPAPSPVPFIDAAIPEPSPEPKDKPAPRRRRPAGSGNKRRRREVDDGDATYPAKRTRIPRSSAAAAATSVGREPSPLHSLDSSAATPLGGDQGGPERPERRATKSRGTRARKDSTASEGTVTSVSASIVTGNGASHKDVGEDALDVDASPSGGPQDPTLANSGKALDRTNLNGGDKVLNHGPG